MAVRNRWVSLQGAKVEIAGSLTQNGKMQRRRKWSAMMALAAIVLPWPAAMAVALHEADDHSSAHADPAAVLHGHEHDHGTPPHDHALTPAPSVASEQLRVYVTRTVRAEAVPVIGSGVNAWVDQSARPRETASPPARSTSSTSVLRI